MMSSAKSQPAFCYLGMKSEYSLVDGFVKLDDYLDYLKSNGHQYASLTDNCGLFGALDFSLKCQERGMLPIIGASLYVSPSDTLVRMLKGWEQPERMAQHDTIRQILKNTPRVKAFELTMLCRSRRGFDLLSRLIADAYTYGLTDDLPVCSWELLRSHLSSDTASEVITLSGCGGGELTYLLRLQQALREQQIQASIGTAPPIGDYPDQIEAAILSYLRELWSLTKQGGLYLEVFDHGIGYEPPMMNQWCELSEKTSIPMLASSDAYYLRRGDAEVHMISLALKQSLQSNQISGCHERAFFGLMSHSQFVRTFEQTDGAIENTLKIAKECSGFYLETEPSRLPAFTVNDKPVDEYSLLEKLSWEGLSHRARGSNHSPNSYEKRLAYELSILKKMGFSGYFLIVHDFVAWAKSRGIAVGAGRGSGAGSLVAYCLGITDIDPLVFGLIFERFLNPERSSYPDLDIDFCQQRRGEVEAYLFGKYGSDRSAHIGTFNRLKSKAAFKGVLRVLGVPFPRSNYLTGMFPKDDESLSLGQIMKMSQELTKLVANDEKIAKAMGIAIKIEGMISHTSIHPAGIVISDKPIVCSSPVYRSKSSPHMISQYEMKTLDKTSLVKFDLLGLKTLSVIQATCQMIEDPNFSIDRIPWDDQRAFKLICSGWTVGIFQAESSSMTQLARELAPSNLDELIALIALHRPGPLGSGMMDTFIRRKHGVDSVHYLHPSLAPILEETRGIIVYQEQVQRIASDLAGYSLGEADILRRAMGKKIPVEMEKQRARFIEGATSRGLDKSMASQIFNLMAEFANYGFNKSHSAAYGVLSYKTAYLKAHYPAKFMLTLLNYDADDTSKVSRYLSEFMRIGIIFKSACLNSSHEAFTLNEQGEIVYGLGTIKGASGDKIRLILECRGSTPFGGILDLAGRIDLKTVGKRCLDLLIGAGALDEFGYSRQGLKSKVPQLIKYSQSCRKKTTSVQRTLFDCMGVTPDEFDPPWLKELTEQSGEGSGITLDDLILEKKLLGAYFSSHPMEHFKDLIASVSNLYRPPIDPTMTAGRLLDNQASCFVDHRFIMFLEKKIPKELDGGKRMLILVMVDNFDQVKGVVFHDDLKKNPKVPKDNRLVVVTARLQKDRLGGIIVSRIEDAEDLVRRAKLAP